MSPTQKQDQYPMPEPRAVIRDGDALLELHMSGAVVGSLNFSQVLRSWWRSGGAQERKGLEVIR